MTHPSKGRHGDSTQLSLSLPFRRPPRPVVRRSPRAPGVGIYSYVHSKTTEFLYLRYLRYSILVARAAPPTNGSAALAGARCCDRERASAQRAAAGSLSAPVCQEGFALY